MLVRQTPRSEWRAREGSGTTMFCLSAWHALLRRRTRAAPESLRPRSRFRSETRIWSWLEREPCGNNWSSKLRISA